VYIFLEREKGENERRDRNKIARDESEKGRKSSHY